MIRPTIATVAAGRARALRAALLPGMDGGAKAVPSGFALLLALVAAGAVLALGPAASAALAHTEPVAFSPRKGALLRKAPRKVTITFAEQILGGSITVRSAAGKVVSTGPSGRDPKNVRRLRVSLVRTLARGTYTVRWSVRAADGDTQTGSYTFRLV